MKYLILILAVFVAIPTFAQDDFPVKTDGTKYYMQVYDGETNEKVVYYNATGTQGWNQLIQVADFFNGSDAQLWSFEESPNFLGYFLVRNRDESVFSTSSLMSWSWNAYLATDASRPPLNEVEKQFRFVEAFDGYYILETIEKPTDGSSYGIFYTPGADAMNVNSDGIVTFRNVKTADITRSNMANKVFKIVEFNPIKLFEESIQRGDNLYKENTDIPDAIRFELFVNLEKAREVRVFGTDAELLEYQPTLDSVLSLFNSAINFKEKIDEAVNFIDTVGVESEIVSLFNALINDAESYISSPEFEYAKIDSIVNGINGAINLVSGIKTTEEYKATLSDLDSRLSDGVNVAVGFAKGVLNDSPLGSDDFTSALDVMSLTEDIIEEIKYANDTIAGTPEFEEAKSALTAVVEEVIALINTTETTVVDLEQALDKIKNATKTFIKSLEAGDILIELKNSQFEGGLTDWNVESPTPTAAYPENKGVDGSRSITFWKGAEYQMMVYQLINNIPNGTYELSCFAKVNADSTIALFGESGANSAVLPIVGSDLVKRVIDVEVTDGTLKFGIKGYGADNTIPAGRWIVFDEFEVKWKSSLTVENSDFEDGLSGWLVEGVTAAAYPENKGVDGSRSITTWRGAAYEISVSQTATGLTNGFYTVSVMAKTNLDSAFVVFGESADSVFVDYVKGADLLKFNITAEVTDGTLKYGIKGAGENNAVPAGRWIVFDNVEVTRMPDVPVLNGGFDSDLANWIVESPTPAAAYAQNRGIDASRSITWWMGSDYQMKVYQSVSNMLNGTYNVSCVYRNSAEGSIGLFAESGVNIVDLPLPLYNNGEQDLTKAAIEITVTNGTLDFGLRGQGDDNGVPAGNWVVYDEFMILAKTIIPNYVVVNPTPSENFVTSNDEILENNELVYWQSNQNLNIRSTDVITNYTVYSVTGAVVENGIANNTFVSVPLKKGIYLISVTMLGGETKVSKTVIR